MGYALVNPDDNACELKLSPGATISGRVIDERGEPIAKAEIECTTSLPPRQLELLGKPLKKLALRPPTVSYFMFTDAEGRFSVPAVLVGSQSSIGVSWKDLSEGWRHVQVSEAKKILVGDIVIKARPRTARND